MQTYNDKGQKSSLRERDSGLRTTFTFTKERGLTFKPNALEQLSDFGRSVGRTLPATKRVECDPDRSPTPHMTKHNGRLEVGESVF